MRVAHISATFWLDPLMIDFRVIYMGGNVLCRTTLRAIDLPMLVAELNRVGITADRLVAIERVPEHR